MAPEISQGIAYDGKLADIFTTGVILFVLVQGIFPFHNASEADFFYKLILDKKYKEYFEKTGSTNLSPEFKNLFLRMVNIDPKKRPTAEEIKMHPWFK